MESQKDSKTKDSKLSAILRKLVGSPASTRLRFANMLTRSRYNAMLHLPDIVSTIESVWKSCVLLTFLMFRSSKTRKLILSTHVSHRGNKWTTFLDKLSICSKDDLNTLPMYLLQTLLLELISKGKDCKPFLDACLQGTVGELVVAHRDRLCRFGFELVESIVTKAGGKITVLDNDGNKSGEQELAEDLLSIIHVYSIK